MSLSELRRTQKEEQAKCSTKTSKIISVKNSQDEKVLSKLNFREKAVEAEEKWKYRSEEYEGSRPKVMKTSLMAKKKGDRKNSDNANTVKSYILKTQPMEKPTVSIFQMGKGQVLSPKESSKQEQPLFFKRPPF